MRGRDGGPARTGAREPPVTGPRPPRPRTRSRGWWSPRPASGSRRRNGCRARGRSPGSGRRGCRPGPGSAGPCCRPRVARRRPAARAPGRSARSATQRPAGRAARARWRSRHRPSPFPRRPPGSRPGRSRWRVGAGRRLSGPWIRRASPRLAKSGRADDREHPGIGGLGRREQRLEAALDELLDEPAQHREKDEDGRDAEPADQPERRRRCARPVARRPPPAPRPAGRAPRSPRAGRPGPPGRYPTSRDRRDQGPEDGQADGEESELEEADAHEDQSSDVDLKARRKTDATAAGRAPLGGGRARYTHARSHPEERGTPCDPPFASRPCSR